MWEVILTFYFLMLGGFILKTLGVFTEKDAKSFVDYIVYFALPVAVFGVIHDFPLEVKDILVFTIAWITIGLTTLLVFKIFSPFIGNEKTVKTFFLTATFGNTAFAGYPISYFLFGDKGLAYAILYDVLGNFLTVVTFAIFIITGRVSWKTVYKFPPLGALILAFLTKGIPLGFLFHFVEVVKNSLTPVIVFSLGLRFNPGGILKNLKLAFWSVFIRMLFIPCLVLGLLVFLKGFIDISYTQAVVILLQSSMPPFVMSVILSEKFKLNTDLAIAAVNLGLIVLPITVSLWVYLGEKFLK